MTLFYISECGPPQRRSSASVHAVAWTSVSLFFAHPASQRARDDLALGAESHRTSAARRGPVGVAAWQRPGAS